ncbi:hybrid sensor histidine kinase/response regulator [Pseudomonas sp. dw_358]|uniref:hybrid sensor histidine kinase/response regulator n=1 Tax=Pseudomonas sp. dw_358 TaxID=2720083 RepID=UPI001BD48E0E|nr:hybrid sensor histidine kinase/response regulator [Pseudomonas sp. dw_358]
MRNDPQVSKTLGPIKLLLVEDSNEDIELTLVMLEKAGLEIIPTVVYDHEGAQLALERDTFDVVVCDYALPGAPGTEVLESARIAAPKTPFIFLSGVLGEQQAVATIRLGAVDYVLKQNLDYIPRAVSRAVEEVQERKKRKEVEQALVEVEARARIAIKAAEMGVWELDPVTNVMIWDERCKALYGLAADVPITLESALAQSHPEDIAGLRDEVTRSMRQESMFHADYRIILPDGRVRWMASDGRSFFEGGVCVRFTGVVQDITERKRATQALVQLTETLGEEVEQRTRERDRTWEMSHEMLGVLHFNLSAVSFNPAWEDALGWTREHLTGLRLWELMHPDDMEATIKEAQSLAKGNVSKRFVNRMRHADGSYRWLSWTIVPDGELMYAAVRDITEERAVLEELATTNQKLLEQVKRREGAEATLQQMQRLEVVGQLTAGVAHDFNNLLTVILTSSTFAIKEFERGKMDRILMRLGHIKASGERGAKLTGQLLSFSRRQRLDPQPIDLNAMIAGMDGLLRKAIGANIDLELSLADHLWMASADPTQTEMVILNLAINARDAMPEGGRLHVRTLNSTVEMRSPTQADPEPGDYVVIQIADSGTGMEPEILKRAFEPFFTTKDVGKGSGLGLAQAFGFAKQSGGGVHIKTAPRKGTTVSVYLPQTEERPLDTLILNAETLDGQVRRTDLVLLVDDEDAVREVAANMLESLGHRVIQANSGARALEVVTAEVNVVLTDFAMPEMNGKALAERLNARGLSIPVIFMTGYADTEVLGLDGLFVIQKPFTEDDLQRVLDRSVEATEL